MSKRLYRSVQASLLLATFFVLASSFYFQYYQNLMPCPLCLMQRICAFLFGSFCLMGLLLSTLERAKWVTGLQFFFAATGLYFALRQLWLQSYGVEAAACMPGLSVLMHYFPWQEVVKALFWGTGSCGEVSWQWLGFSMPAWTALYFFVMILITIILLWYLRKRLNQLP